jgi:hypothetical protein
MGTGGIAQRILSLGIRLRSVVSFESPTIHSGYKAGSGSCGEEKILYSSLGIEPQFLGHPARSLVTIPTEPL